MTSAGGEKERILKMNKYKTTIEIEKEKVGAEKEDNNRENEEERAEEKEKEEEKEVEKEESLEGNDDAEDLSFDIVTGTPPYFPSKNGALPQDAGRGQCAFECRGGIEAYIRACTVNISSRPFARFIVCQTYLEVKMTEKSAAACGMVICKRLDVYGREGQTCPLFCVFSMRKRRMKDEEEGRRGEEDGRQTELSDNHDDEEERGEGEEEGGESGGGEVPYCVITLYVRKVCGCHTSDYDAVMREMGRPLSTCGCGQ
jgi:hypothetical protein